MLSELRERGKLRGHRDLLESWIDEGQRRIWFLLETTRKSQ